MLRDISNYGKKSEYQLLTLIPFIDLKGGYLINLEYLGAIPLNKKEFEDGEPLLVFERTSHTLWPMSRFHNLVRFFVKTDTDDKIISKIREVGSNIEQEMAQLQLITESLLCKKVETTEITTVYLKETVDKLYDQIFYCKKQASKIS